MSNSAEFSPGRQYRYKLTRDLPMPTGHQRWKPLLFIGLNPSKAGADDNDSTVTIMMGFGTRWECTSLTMVNIFDFIETHSTKLGNVAEPVSPANQSYLDRELRHHSPANGGVILCAWGAHKLAMRRSREAGIYGQGLSCLGINADGSPWHPLRRSYSTPLKPWNGYRP